MKKKNKTINKNLLLILTIVLLLLVSFCILQFKNLQINNNNLNSNTSAAQGNTVTSKNMKLSIDVPNKYDSEEKFTLITLKNGEKYILVSRNGTNFSNLEEYVRDLSEKNNFNLLEQKVEEIHGLSSINGIVQPSSAASQSKIYFIYKDNFVYTLETSFKELYGDLDQIAQSFRYTP